MKIHYRHLNGRVEILEFSDWLKRNYIPRDLINCARKIKEGYLKEL